MNTIESILKRNISLREQKLYPELVTVMTVELRTLFRDTIKESKTKAELIKKAGEL